MNGITRAQLAAVPDEEIAALWKEASDLAKVAARISGWQSFGINRRRFFFEMLYTHIVGAVPSEYDRTSEYA